MRVRDINKESRVKEEACRLVVENGFESFSMNKLAKACSISVATLYIYYKNKEDLFQRLGVEISQEYYDTMLKDFNPEMTFKEGLWKQWQNRARFALAHPYKVAFHQKIQSSNYDKYVMTITQKTLTNLFKKFIQNCISRREIKPVSNEVFWSIAYGPLYTLIRFHNRGKSYDEAVYQLNEEEMKASFAFVLAALSR